MEKQQEVVSTVTIIQYPNGSMRKYRGSAHVLEIDGEEIFVRPYHTEICELADALYGRDESLARSPTFSEISSGRHLPDRQTRVGGRTSNENVHRPIMPIPVVHHMLGIGSADSRKVDC
ncbi:hypothetical protein ACLOJK_012326 [Asimina triloba]